MYTPKFKDGQITYGIVGGEIKQVTINKVMVSPNATDAIHVTNTDTEGRNWNDNHLHETPEDLVKVMMEKFYTKYPNERPKDVTVGDDKAAADKAAADKAAADKAAADKATADKAAADKAAADKAAADKAKQENPEA